jgi:hypothetical protein
MSGARLGAGSRDRSAFAERLVMLATGAATIDEVLTCTGHEV